ncbi:hypothetical protein GTA28_28110 [Rhodococcus hoagii]|nr:hypothetical protein [Prescottella equi]
MTIPPPRVGDERVPGDPDGVPHLVDVGVVESAERSPVEGESDVPMVLDGSQRPPM